jgi:hypothetical protein
VVEWCLSLTPLEPFFKDKLVFRCLEPSGIEPLLPPPLAPPHQWKGADLIPSFVHKDFQRFSPSVPSPTSSVFRPHGLAGCAWPSGHARPKNLLVAHATNGFTHGRVVFSGEKFFTQSP